MQIYELKKIKGPIVIQPRVFKDERGFFIETFQESSYKQNGITPPFPQDNHSFSQKGTIRGMHFQAPPGPGQAKLVRVPVGRILDVVVDIRPDSPTFGQWEGVILDDQLHEQLFIPIGFAHGFCVLSETAHVMYKVSSPYQAQYEKGFRWNDPTVGIVWPAENPIVSNRDSNSPFLRDLIESKLI